MKKTEKKICFAVFNEGNKENEIYIFDSLEALKGFVLKEDREFMEKEYPDDTSWHEDQNEFEEEIRDMKTAIEVVERYWISMDNYITEIIEN